MMLGWLKAAWVFMTAIFGGASDVHDQTIKQAGRDAQTVDDQTETLKDVQVSNETRTQVGRMPARAAADELRRNWSRHD